MANLYAHFKPVNKEPFKSVSNEKESLPDFSVSTPSSSEDEQPSGVPVAVGMKTFHELQACKVQLQKMSSISDTVANSDGCEKVTKATTITGNTMNNEFSVEVKETKEAQVQTAKELLQEETETVTIGSSRP